MQNSSFIKVALSTIRLKEEYRWLSETDPLTGMKNRRAIMSTIEAVVMSKSQGFLAMLDIDDFKIINDKRCHAAGDMALIALAKILKDLGPGVMSGRIGGEEFALLFSDMTDVEVVKVLQVALARANNGCAGVALGFSAGLIKLSDVSLSEHLRKVDERMYHAKRSGKKVVYSDATTNTRIIGG